MNFRNIVGIVFIILGALYLADSFELIEFSFWKFIGQYWALLIVGYGITKLSKGKTNLFEGIVIVVVGLLLLANSLDFIELSFWQLFFPVLLILIGVWVILSKSKSYDYLSKNSVDRLKISAIFSGERKIINSQDFQGGELSAVFSGIELDLRDVKVLNNELFLDVSLVFSGLELYIPLNWKVVVIGNPAFSAIEDKTKPILGDDLVILNLKYSSAFSGLEIRN